MMRHRLRRKCGWNAQIPEYGYKRGDRGVMVES